MSKFLFVSLVIILSIFISIASPTWAQDTEKVNSYELFWPMVAWKTIDDPLYSLKRAKEKVVGILVFGSAKKAEYNAFLGTKRMLEAESLLGLGQEEKAAKTLNLAVSEFTTAKEKVLVLGKTRVPPGIRSNIIDRAARVRDFANFLAKEKEGEIKSYLEKVDDLTSDTISALQ